MATNSILNTEKKIRAMKNSAPTENKKSMGLLSRSNNDTMKEEQNDLAVDLKLKIRKNTSKPVVAAIIEPIVLITSNL